ncbi:MAG TPA: crossover junction endodeoxyribonuclease RuvC [Candidatus Kryptonia bacterium]|nr:crossover junction endodeoxyribonuclease RuvC [Candidatus Kryptonia bacterium]
MRVLGIDPGTVTTGWGVVEERGTRLFRVAGGVVRARGPLAERLGYIFGEIEVVVARSAPAALSLEKNFVAANVQSAFRLGEARGAVRAAAARAGVTVSEYSPAEIKLAVAGTGRATKDQMQTMVRRLLSLRDSVTNDEADALGAAICHLHNRRFAERTGQGAVVALVRARRRRTGRRWTSLTVVPSR